MIRAAALLAIFVLVGCTLGQQGAFDLSTYGKPSPASAISGTVGDGIADDYAGLQAAINATPAGGTLDLSTGRYRISETIIIDKPMVLMANGTVGVPGPGQIVQTDPNKDAIWLISPAATVHGIGVWGAGRGTGTGHGIVIAGPGFRSDDGRIRSCWFTGIPMCAIDARGSQGYHISNNGIENSTIGLRIAYQATVLDAGNNNVITDNRFYGNTRSGLEICNGKWNVVHSNIFDYNGLAHEETGAAWIHGPPSPGLELRENSICNNVFNINGSNGIQITSSSDNLVSGNIISRSIRRGILVQSGNFCDINGNTIRMSDRDNTNLYPGVELVGSQSVRLMNNSSMSFAPAYGQSYGFKINAGCAAMTIMGNTGIPSFYGAFSITQPITAQESDEP